MPKFAQYDPTQSQPTPVIGWYNTDEFEYPHMPGAVELVSVSDTQWALHFQFLQDWTVKDGQLIPPNSEPK